MTSLGQSGNSDPFTYAPITVLTAGVDLSSQDAKTAACLIEWSPSKAEVIELDLNIADGAIASLIGSVDKLGIDVPLGWPVEFTRAVFDYSNGGSWPEEYEHQDNVQFRLRRTDIWLWKDLGMAPPLSVSADRIALPAMRAASLLSRLPMQFPRDGSGTVVEVYPAAALRQWGLPSRGYKSKDNLSNRRQLVEQVLTETSGWLEISTSHVDLCLQSDDALDSLIASLVARAAATGHVEEIPSEDHLVALKEGWIAVPLVASLHHLPLSR